MKTINLAVVTGLMILVLAGCGDSGSVYIAPPPATFVADILSNPAFDGDIEQTSPSSFTITQGMSPTVQSVFAGINPATLTEFRAFLDFPLGGAGGVPSNAVIVSAFLDIFITSVQTSGTSIPIRIELVNFQPPTLLATDFDRTLLPPLAFTTIVPPISPADVGRHVFIDVTALMVEAQRLNLPDFQVRILQDFVPAPPGIIEINDTTGVNRGALAPLLSVEYL